jgi:DNA-binding LytR/AlgR family response regulator
VSSIKILAVEADLSYAESLELVIRELGYELVGIADNALAAMQLINSSAPDLVIMDIEIDDYTSRIELASTINSAMGIPIIYVTASKDLDMFEKAKMTRPKAYIIKPYDTRSLQAAIELAIFNAPVKNATGLQRAEMGDTFYIKDSDRLVKVRLRDIELVEVDNRYCFIDTAQKRHTVHMHLADLLAKLPREDFIQVHVSYVVRKSAIEEVNIGHQTLRIRDKIIPIGKAYRERLLTTLNFLT